ncbi:MAG TPA: DUF4350 domain-containing protein [Pyrinomonadaceae bacterium]|nr:DUF4350 domain-containing protein [Pyrinomonadaceae bacterium]
MRQRIAIIATVVIVIGILILVNALGYAKSSEETESELMPNRSTYNAGATGTRALYDLLYESGFKVTRWRESSSVLLGQASNDVSTFVVIGRTLISFQEDEARNLLLWVEKGGRLVLVDRRPDPKLLPKSGNWNIAVDLLEYPTAYTDPTNQKDMTEGVVSVHPVQPTSLTRTVESVKPSRFASVIKFTYARPESGVTPNASPSPSPDAEEDPEVSSEDEHSPLTQVESDAPPADQSFPAPVVHLQHHRGAMLVDFPHGAGKIVVLSDPFIVANSGIKLEDNLELALRTVASRDGLIAFDEYHQGRAIAHNAFAAYFAGTPVLPMLGQVVLVVLMIVWTNARRFGRPLPLPHVDRRSSLEFVASMAELQHRARALDLAIENIYARIRRVLTRYAGVDYHSSRVEIADRVAARSNLNRVELEGVMRECEETINGSPISERHSVALVGKLRDIEASLGLRMRSREVRQAARSKN